MEDKGLQLVAARMAKSFGEDAVHLSAERYGDHLRHQTESGQLRMTSTGLLTTTGAGATLRKYDFYGPTTYSRS